MTPLVRNVTDTKIARVLIAGFAVMLVITLVSGLVGLRNLNLIRQKSSELVAELSLSSTLIVEIQLQLNNVRAVSHRLTNDPGGTDDASIRRSLDDADASIARIVEGGLGTPEEQRWRDLAEASRAYSAEARRLLQQGDPTSRDIDNLYRRRDTLIRIAAGLINLSNRRAVQAHAQIDTQTRQMLDQTVYVVGGFLLLAAAFAVVTLRMATRLIRTMERQSGDLARVSWNLVENQEATARRFSHELHDELGQSLTAIKANLAALTRGTEDRADRVRDCLALVDESIHNVREMSQLLHPRMLDDFGLDATLGSLVERFAERTGIKVNYESTLKGRLSAQKATHLFRIAQEALTNVSKHSTATEVTVRLWQKGGLVGLTIQDNGKGFVQPADDQRKGLGLITMGARARNLGGAVRFGQPADGGAMVDVEVPAGGDQDGDDSDSTGR